MKKLSVLSRTLACAAVAGMGLSAPAHAQAIWQKPYMGWSSFSLQATTISGYGNGWLTEWQMQVQSAELKATLQPYGYNYFNIDSGWAGGFDGYGRPSANTSTFPDGIPWIANIVHGNGQKLGVYWVPGVGSDVYNANPPIYGTPYHIQDIVAQPLATGDAFGSWHLKIDFTKPGAQEYINSVINQFAAWGVDFLKLDGVSPGSDQTLSYCDNRPDVQAYQTAIQQCGRPMWLTISWRISDAYIPFWQTYSNARRIDDDIDAYSSTLTNWKQTNLRFGDAANWAPWAGAHGYNNNYSMGSGWNDLDSIDVGNGSMDGLTNNERQTAITFWAQQCSPLYTGDDLYHLDSYGVSLLTNPFIIAMDQAGNVATQIQSGNSQVWSTDNGDGTRTVGLYNLGSGSATVSVNWSAIGLSGNQQVHDVWANTDIVANGGYSASLASHACRLIKVSTPHIISLDFVGSGTAMGSSENAGVVGAASWNNASGQSGSGLGLVDSSGASSGASAAWSASAVYATGVTDTAGSKRMMKGYLDTYSGATSTVTVSGLPSYYTTHGYDVYVYSDGSNGGATRVYKYAIGPSNIQINDAVNTDFSGAFTQASSSAGNYARFSALSGSSFTLSATPVSSTDAYLRAPINGIQIVGH
ncbi:hypothetical protein CCAX7_53490 [Capsulimonas corticalis]|uniref:Alpha-galactosidase n=1 Tax=Capsulimonas corticalis TaxID=2219043 RepID=A0A402CNU8_9BACT|nr:glycoside hydrolase family 27 protein [Capsulimonas corticalis]BDI33298.1 hypothetical protein CCAX7_53490 [Capsulimonas corticalis]